MDVLSEAQNLSWTFTCISLFKAWSGDVDTSTYLNFDETMSL